MEEKLSWRPILFAQYKKQPLPICISYILILFVAFGAIIQPLFLTLLVDGLILEKDNGFIASIQTNLPQVSTLGLLFLFAGMMIGLRFAIWFASWYFNDVFINIAKRVSMQMRTQLLKRLQNTSLHDIQTIKHGRLVQMLINDVEIVEDFLHHVTTNLLTASIGIVGTIGVVSWFHPKLGALLAIVNISIIIMGRFLGKRIKKLKKQDSAALASLQSDFLESVSNIHELRANSNDAYFFLRLMHQTRSVLKVSKRLQWTTEIITRLSSTLHMSGFDIYRLFCVFLILSQSLTLGETLAAINYLWVMIGGMNEIINLQYKQQSANGALERIDYVSTLTYQTKATINYTPNKNDALICQDVSFQYPGQNKQVIECLNFHLETREKVAIFGESGCGKSTFINLLLGLYRPTGGTICIDKYATHTLSSKSKKRIFSVVLQQSALLNDSIRVNLCLGNSYTEKELWQALKHAVADDFVSEMPKGLETIVGNNGARLSGGQKQRIAIARAMLNPAHIVIFDEATSSLDLATEQKLLHNIFNNLQQSACIFISHRKTILSFVNKMYNLEYGRLTTK